MRFFSANRIQIGSRSRRDLPIPGQPLPNAHFEFFDCTHRQIPHFLDFQALLDVRLCDSIRRNLAHDMQSLHWIHSAVTATTQSAMFSSNATSNATKALFGRAVAQPDGAGTGDFSSTFNSFFSQPPATRTSDASGMGTGELSTGTAKGSTGKDKEGMKSPPAATQSGSASAVFSQAVPPSGNAQPPVPPAASDTAPSVLNDSGKEDSKSGLAVTMQPNGPLPLASLENGASLPQQNLLENSTDFGDVNIETGKQQNSSARVADANFTGGLATAVASTDDQDLAESEATSPGPARDSSVKNSPIETTAQIDSSVPAIAQASTDSSTPKALSPSADTGNTKLVEVTASISSDIVDTPQSTTNGQVATLDTDAAASSFVNASLFATVQAAAGTKSDATTSSNDANAAAATLTANLLNTGARSTPQYDVPQGSLSTSSVPAAENAPRAAANATQPSSSKAAEAGHNPGKTSTLANLLDATAADTLSTLASTIHGRLSAVNPASVPSSPAPSSSALPASAANSSPAPTQNTTANPWNGSNSVISAVDNSFVQKFSSHDALSNETAGAENPPTGASNQISANNAAVPIDTQVAVPKPASNQPSAPIVSTVSSLSPPTAATLDMPASSSGAKSNSADQSTSAHAPEPNLPSPAVATGPVQLAQIASKAAQAEMRVGLNTSAFGGVEVRTVVHASDVGLVIGSEKGDLRSLLANEIPTIANSLQQQNLRLSQVNFHQGFGFSADLSHGGGHSQPRYFSASSTGRSPFLETSSATPELNANEIPSSSASGLNILA